MTRLIALAALLVASVDASGGYYYAPLGPWGLESTIINAKAIRDADKEIKTTSRKSGGKKKDEVEEVKSEIDDLEAAEEAFFHAVEKVEHAVELGLEKVEHAVENALDDEVETLFPHHQKSEEE